MAKKTRIKSNKLQGCYCEDEIIGWFLFNNLSVIEVHRKIMKEKKFKVSEPTVYAYKKNILPNVSEERINKIKASIEVNRIDGEESVIKRLSELKNSIEYLSEEQENFDIINKRKNNFIKRNEEIELEIDKKYKEIEKLGKSSKKEEKGKKKDDKVDESTIEALESDITAFKRQITSNEEGIVECIQIMDKLVITMQKIRVGINKVLGDTWSDKIKDVIDNSIGGFFDIINPHIIDTEREKLKAKTSDFIKNTYKRYGIKDGFT